MAKKRVHEIAKEKGIPSKEVIAKLQAAGLDVKAAASSVDEADIEMAFNGKPKPEHEAEQPEAAGKGGAATGDAGGKPKQPPSQGGGERGPKP
ncbi:MAG: translation initiation factor IF-2 N-terminal domain-containing protein, partial [Thermoleophilaceae bacterium]|nr:translation initiation factor IF-2 N-terminal domain-containing protein [Thermoleophilaceae bacterium]